MAIASASLFVDVVGIWYLLNLYVIFYFSIFDGIVRRPEARTIWTNADVLPIEPLGTNLNRNWMEIKYISCTKQIYVNYVVYKTAATVYLPQRVKDSLKYAMAQLSM